MKHPGKTSPAEFRAAAIVIIILIASVIAPGIYDRFSPPQPAELPVITHVEIHSTQPDDQRSQAHRSATARNNFDDQRTWRTKERRTETTHFKVRQARAVIHCQPFDPNAVGQDTLIAMGLDVRIAGNIVKYRNAGGRFRKSDDLLKIYGLDSMTYHELKPCLVLGEDTTPEKRPASRGKIDINTAGLAEWKALPGIGDVLADRIVRFRDHLGGFHSVSQVAGTYGLQLETFEMISEMLVVGVAPSRIDINTATVELLQGHPYITARQATAIVNYRQHHGKFTQVEDILKVLSLSEEWLRQTSPYLQCDGENPAADLVVR